MEWARHVACVGDKRVAYVVIFRRDGRKRTFGRPRCTWKDKIKIYFQEVGWKRMDWIDLAEYRDW